MVITRTPFRISFFGGGTDYPVWYEKNGGAVLSTSIDKYCYIFCREFPPFFDHKLRVVWSKIELVNHREELEHPTARAAMRFLDITHGVEVHHDGDLPARSGLGSSSSFTVGLLHALRALQGRHVTKRQLAMDALHVEQQIANLAIGSQDQVAAAYGGLNRIRFGGPQVVRVDPVPVSPERLQALQDRLMLFFTGLARTASEVAVDWIQNASRNERELIRMQEMVNEAIAILNAKTDLRAFGDLLHETWQRKRGLAGSISTPQIDDIYDAAREAGAVGGKLLGAGAGGFMLFYAEPDRRVAVIEKLRGLLHVPFRFEKSGSRVIYRGPAVSFS